MTQHHSPVYNLDNYGEQANTLTIDSHHKILVFVATTGVAAFVPMHARRWVFQPYTNKDSIVTFSSYKRGAVNAQISAVQYIQRSTQQKGQH